MLLSLTAMKISEKFFSIVYIIFSLFLGYLLYTFLIAVPIRIMLVFYFPPFYISLSVLYGLPLIICIYGVINALITKIVKINLKYPGFKGKYTILHLSDIHLGAIHQKGSVQRIVKEIQNLEEPPDIVVITGDLADGSLKIKADWLSPFDSLEMPILYITGNHEQFNPKKDMLNEVRMTNIKYIGELGTFVHKGVNFIGADYEYDLKEIFSEVKIEENMPNVFLFHVPEIGPDDLKEHNIFLFLAGHTHGGQIFPLNIAAYFSNKCFSGLYSDREKMHHVFVSEGVNNAVVPMRVCSKRVFPIITIEGEISD
jgi:predicted MPP superfamily phosphohydrolase